MLRVVKALVSNGLFSIMSLLMSVVIARSGGAEDLGMFGVAYAAYLLVQLLVRDAGANTLSATLPSARRIRITAGRISLMGCVFAVPVFLTGLIFNYPYLTVLGLAIHGMSLYDYSKTLSLSLSDGKMALKQDVILFVLFVVAALLTIAGVIDSVGLMCAWAFCCAGLGYLASFLQVFRLMPRWAGDDVELKASLGFGLQSLIGSGSVHVLTFLLTGIGGPFLIGAMRGASTIIGPANLITSSLQPLLITYFARTAPYSGAVSTKAVLRSSVGLFAVHLFVVAGLVLTGINFGELVLGDVWQYSAPLLTFVAIDSIFVAIGSGPMAAHRTLWAAKRLARINTIVVMVRIPLVLVAAVLWGAQGVVTAFMVVTIATTAAWWSSFLQMQNAA